MPGSLYIRRRVAPPDVRDWAYWRASTLPMQRVDVDTQGRIEDDARSVQADFANKYIGGGVLMGGCVQEEIRLVIKRATMNILFTSALHPQVCH